MNIRYFVVLLAIISIVAFGCAQTATTDAMDKKDAMMEDKAMAKEGDAMEKSEEVMEKEETMMDNSGYKGKILAGTTTKYIDFNKDDYEKALKDKKKILLYFYANWCPICKKEQPETFAAFNKLNDPDLIGFRVNYRDSATDSDEENLAKEFGVSYQHTKVILKNGERVGKFPDSWDKQRYLDELEKV